MTAPHPAQGTPGGTDRTTLWGVLGIVLGVLCCGILGIIFGWLSLRDARRCGRSPMLGYLAIVLGVLNIAVNAILRATGHYPNLY